MKSTEEEIKEDSIRETMLSFVSHPGWTGIIRKEITKWQEQLQQYLENCPLDDINLIRGELKGIRRVLLKVEELTKKK